MEKLRQLWYRLVANRLLYKIANLEAANQDLAARHVRQLGITREYATEWTRASERCSKLEQQIASEDTKVVMEGVKMAMGGGRNTEGKIDLLRQQLKQELAYIAYLEEIVDGVDHTPFNKLPLEKRKEYFERIEKQVQ